jgi:hypothetical protein
MNRKVLVQYITAKDKKEQKKALEKLKDLF